METHTSASSIRTLGLAFAVVPLGLISFLISAEHARADPAAELASFSVFPKVDLAQASKGDSKPVRGPASSNPRHLSIQTVYVAPVPPPQLLTRMREWSPTRHPELKVYLHSDNATNFSQLQNAPDNGAVRYLVSATAKRSNDLQLSAAEMKQLAAENGADERALFVSAWPKILSARAQAFASGGSASQPAYENVSPPVRPNDELSGLLRGQDKIRRHFSDLLDSTGIGRGAGSIKPEMYWELLSADEKGVLTLGASYHKTGSAGAIQTANTLYYASGGYYTGVTLQQLWPVDVEGRASTLVWRGDMISSGTVGTLRGIERMAAESTMIKDIARDVSLFRRDIGGSR